MIKVVTKKMIVLDLPKNLISLGEPGLSLTVAIIYLATHLKIRTWFERFYLFVVIVVFE